MVSRSIVHVLLIVSAVLLVGVDCHKPTPPTNYSDEKSPTLTHDGGGVVADNRVSNGTAPISTDNTRATRRKNSSRLLSRRRAAKILEKPLDSQLNTIAERLIDKKDSRDNLGSASDKHVQAKVGTVGDQVRRQELEVDPSLLFTEGPPIHFPAVVSPLEASFGGLTGLQGLPPLSLIQFLKILVAVTPFVIPLVFIPLLIFTVGVTLIPVTRSNLFIERGRQSDDGRWEYRPGFMFTYLVQPIKDFTGNVLVPRAEQFYNALISHEQCVERISCEISARLHIQPNWDERAGWRSIANASWISR